jgi:hypothetical protein
MAVLLDALSEKGTGARADYIVVSPLRLKLNLLINRLAV